MAREERQRHRFYDFWVPRSMTYPHQPLSALMDFAANQRGERMAMIFYGAEVSQRDPQSHPIRRATVLDVPGIRPGDRVGIVLPNCPQFLKFLYAHPAVLEAAVVGVPDPYRGEAVKAYVALQPGAPASEAEILEHCWRNLAPYKVPQEIEFRDSLPKPMVGKALRSALREAAPGHAAPRCLHPRPLTEWVPRLLEAASVTPQGG
jgi:acyl-CoA synthetase (AMP-forming)/AMP-acid ligase II